MHKFLSILALFCLCLWCFPAHAQDSPAGTPPLPIAPIPPPAPAAPDAPAATTTPPAAPAPPAAPENPPAPKSDRPRQRERKSKAPSPEDEQDIPPCPPGEAHEVITAVIAGLEGFAATNIKARNAVDHLRQALPHLEAFRQE